MILSQAAAAEGQRESSREMRWRVWTSDSQRWWREKERRKAEGRNKHLLSICSVTCLMQSAKTEPCSERLNNLAEVAQLISDHSGVEMDICLAPKACAFSVAKVTFKGEKEPQKRRRNLQTHFSYCTFPQPSSLSVKKIRGSGFLGLQERI